MIEGTPALLRTNRDALGKASDFLASVYTFEWGHFYKVVERSELISVKYQTSTWHIIL